MANNPFDRTIIRPLEKTLSEDHDQEFSQSDRTLRDLLSNLFAGRASDASPAKAFQSGFIADSYQVFPSSPAAFSVVVKAGFGFQDDAADVPVAIDGVTGLDDRSRYKPLTLLNDFTFAVPAAPGAPNSRVDIIEVKADRRVDNPITRQVFNTVTEQFEPTSINKTLAFSHDGRTGTVTSPTNSTVGLSYKTGVAGNPGAVPSTSPGYIKIAEINVDNTTATVTEAELVDRRPLLGEGGFVTAGFRFRLQFNGGAPIVTVKSWDLPPGLKATIIPGGGRGELAVDLFGGEISRVDFSGIAMPSFESGNVLTSSQAIVSMMQQSAAVGSQIATLTSVFQAGLASGTPIITAGIGSKFASGLFDLRFIDNAGSPVDSTNAKLEDVDWHIQARVGYF